MSPQPFLTLLDIVRDLTILIFTGTTLLWLLIAAIANFRVAIFGTAFEENRPLFKFLCVVHDVWVASKWILFIVFAAKLFLFFLFY